MSRKIHCDYCDTIKGTILEFDFKIGSHPDPSGHGYEGEYNSIAICEECLFKYLQAEINAEKKHILNWSKK